MFQCVSADAVAKGRIDLVVKVLEKYGGKIERGDRAQIVSSRVARRKEKKGEKEHEEGISLDAEIETKISCAAKFAEVPVKDTRNAEEKEGT